MGQVLETVRFCGVFVHPNLDMRNTEADRTTQTKKIRKRMYKVSMGKGHTSDRSTWRFALNIVTKATTVVRQRTTHVAFPLIGICASMAKSALSFVCKAQIAALAALPITGHTRFYRIPWFSTVLTIDPGVEVRFRATRTSPHISRHVLFCGFFDVMPPSVGLAAVSRACRRQSGP